MTRFSKAEKELKERSIEWDSELLKELPEWLRKAYLKDINYCEHRGCKNKKLEIHRIKRNWENGLYSPDNIKVLCSIHHDFYHSNEFSNCQNRKI